MASSVGAPRLAINAEPHSSSAAYQPSPQGRSKKKARVVSTSTHIRTLLWKNYVLKKCRYVATLLEIILPVLFILLMSALKTLTDEVNVPAGWSDPANPSDDSMGTSYNLFDPQGISADQLGVPFGGPYRSNKYAMSETTVPGFLLMLSMKSASELKDVDMLTLKEKAFCKTSVGFYGMVSLDNTSATAIPEVCRGKVTPYKLAITPDNTFTRVYFYETMKMWYPSVSLSTNVVNSGGSKVKMPSFEDSVTFFETERDLEQYITSAGYGTDAARPKIYGAIVFDQLPAEDKIGTFASIEYSVRLNSTVGRRGLSGEVPRTTGDPAFDSPFHLLLDTQYYSRYAVRGFMTLQTMVTRFLNCMPEWDATTKTTSGKCQSEKAVATKDDDLDTRLYQVIENDLHLQNGLFNAYGGQHDLAKTEFASISPADKELLLAPLRIAPQPYFGAQTLPFPTQKFVSSPFYDSVKSVFSIVFILAYLYAVSRILVVLIQEKETRAREYMKILGVGESSIVASWYITYTLILFVACILQAIASKSGLFAASDPVLIFLFFFLFSMSVLSFGFLVSTFFSRARTGAFAGMVLFFLMYFVSSGFSTSSSMSSKSIGCLLSPVALAFGVQALATVEATGVGMNFGNAKVVNDNFKFEISLGMMFLDTFLYTLLGFYFERVIPKEYGTSERWYFFVSPAYWRKNFGTPKINDSSMAIGSQDDAVIDIKNPNVENVSDEFKQQEQRGEALVIHNMHKEFQVPGGIKKAVRGVSMSMYKDQITCLLGHNGAGKTTLISMLTGIIAPSAGDAYFHGMSFNHHMPEIRKSLGLCFQHDVLYAELTVEEHLMFYGRIKGYRGAELQEVVSSKIREVGLTEKRRAFTSDLSGGMKRKLSVAISLLGDSSLVFLDEPTSGMDPYSRRSTWEILLNNRQNRVMVLTTHFMDEADILGDRIAIMAEGQLRCCGSSLFLKNRYGAGYNFTIVKQEGCVETALIQLVTSKVPQAKVLSNVGAEIAFQLPLDSTALFPSLFEEMDGYLADLGVLSYGISVTTLEEVFIKVAEAGDEDHQHTLKKDAADEKHDATTKAKTPSIDNLHGWVMFSVHLEALLLKRFRIAKRDRRVILFSAFLPVALLTAGLFLLKGSSLTKADLKLPLDTTKFTSGVTMPIPYYCQSDEDKWCSHAMDTLFVGGKPHSITPAEFGAYDSSSPTVFGVKYTNPTLAPSDTSGFCVRMGEKIYQRGFGFGDEEIKPADPVKDQFGGYLMHTSTTLNLFGYNVFINTTAVHGSIIFKALMDQALYRLMAADGSTTTAPSEVTLKVNTNPLPLTITTKALFGSFLSFTACIFIVIAFAFFPASIVVFLVKEKQSEHNSKHQQLVSGVSLPAFWLANYIWDFLTYMVPFLAAIILIQIFDVSVFTGNGCNSCTSETYGAVIFLFFLFGLAICPFTYVLSYFFKEHASSQTYTIILNFMIGVVLMVVSFVLDQLETSQDANKVLKYFWRLSPLFNLGNGLLNLAMHEILSTFGLFGTDKRSPYDLNMLGWEMFYLGVTAFLFCSLSVGMDYMLSFPKIKGALFRDPSLKDEPYEEDEDVKREAERVMSGFADTDAVKLRGIRKVYKGNKIAVRNLSFGLPKGECFGYLGINGAGKTTTMKMLTGDILPSAGQGTLGGFDILSQQIEVRRLIGYCPQFDALFELMSVREHLELFARIKGVPKVELDGTVKELMRQMNLDDFEHKLAGTLSGGNKRKLSVAIAMIGSPPIIFLDEPSTGMDPVSRRFMWNVIADISTTKKESTIILTTHSMEECEALCTRVGIMVGGRMRCLGSIQHLKNRFGNGLMIDIKLNNASNEEVNARVTHAFGALDMAPITREQLTAVCVELGNPSWVDKIQPQHSSGYNIAAALDRDGSVRRQAFVAWWIAEERMLTLDAFLTKCFGQNKVQLLEQQNDFCRYKLIGDNNALKLSKVFKLVEDSKQDNHIREYSVSQTTLEQIFNSFASQQSEEKGVARGMVVTGGGAGAAGNGS